MFFYIIVISVKILLNVIYIQLDIEILFLSNKVYLNSVPTKGLQE